MIRHILDTPAADIVVDCLAGPLEYHKKQFKLVLAEMVYKAYNKKFETMLQQIVDYLNGLPEGIWRSYSSKDTVLFTRFTIEWIAAVPGPSTICVLYPAYASLMLMTKYFQHHCPDHLTEDEFEYIKENNDVIYHEDLQQLINDVNQEMLALRNIAPDLYIDYSLPMVN